MAVTVTQIQGGFNARLFDVVATANGDTTAVITHGFPATPVTVLFTPLDPAFYISAWVLTSISSTVVTLTKTVTAGSGAAPAQVRVLVNPFHTHQLMAN